MVFPILGPVQLRTRPFYRLFNYRHSPRGQGIHRFQEMGEGSGAEVRLTNRQKLWVNHYLLTEYGPSAPGR